MRAAMQFADRKQAGELLARELLTEVGAPLLVLGLPRGGVPVAHEVAVILEAPLDVLVSRKLGAPMQPELGMGAIAEGPAIHLNRDVISLIRISPPALMAVIRREFAEVRRRQASYRAGRQPPDLRGRTVLLVDDGIATGGTTRAAIKSARRRGAERIVLATPVAPPETLGALAAEVDRIVCLLTPDLLVGIGAWYADFRQVPDAEVIRLLEEAGRRPPEARRGLAS